MKKYCTLIIALGLLFSMTGCCVIPRIPAPTAPADTTPVPPAPTMNETVAATLPAETEEVLDNTTYLDTVLTCDPNEYADSVSTIIFSPDLTFTMTLNIFEAFGNLRGTYLLTKDGIVECTVVSKDFVGFDGDELKSFSLLPEEDNCYTIRLDGMEEAGALITGSTFRAK